ncbi:MAG: aminoglycoside phosphotransferase, partial [Alphaproteobacteria bacterium]|nr:aminoglycoside phosphotransferase [Alphaproteobacteria bacterium]
EKSYHANQVDFSAWYSFLAAQRHAKVLGIFTRLYRRDNKDIYLKHLPRVSTMLQNHLANPLLAPLNSWFSENIPDFATIPKSLQPKP